MSATATSLQGGNLSADSLESAVDDVKEATETLADDLRDAGTPDTEDGQQAKDLVDQLADEIDEAWLEGVTTVGLTSGASVPDVLVDGVLEWLGERGYADVETVKTADESITFSLPKELRRDLRAEAAALSE